MNEMKPTVLIVDDMPDNIALVNEILKGKYRVLAATNGKRALEISQKTIPDIILMDVMMPEMDGYETCSLMREKDLLKDIPILFLTAKSDDEDEKRGLSLGASDYIIKPVSPSILTARIKTHLELKRSKDALIKQNRFLDSEVQRRIKSISIIQEASIMAMAALAETRDNETGRHLRRAKHYIEELAEYMGDMRKYKDILTPARIKMIALSSPLHDIGKIGIPDHILLKPGPLSKEEYDIMKKHPIIGRDAIVRAEKLIGDADTFLTCARMIAYSHHEKWDGSGYPEGLSGEDIPLSARLMAIVDAYDALTSERVYKKAVSHEEAIAIIEADSGKHFDPDVVKAFLALKEKFKHISKIYKDETDDITV